MWFTHSSTLAQREKEHGGLLFLNSTTHGWVHTCEGIPWEPECHFSGLTFGNQMFRLSLAPELFLKFFPGVKPRSLYAARCFLISCIITKMHTCWFYCALIRCEICWGWQLIPGCHGVRPGQLRKCSML